MYTLSENTPPLHAVAILTNLNFGCDLGKFLLGSSQLGISSSKSLSLGLHITEYLIELHNVDGPCTQSSCSKGLGADKLGFKLRVGKIRFDGLQVGILDVLLVKVDQSV